MAALFVAAMREWKRSFESQSRSFAGLQMRIDKVMSVSIAREGRAAGPAAAGVGDRGVRQPFRGPVRHGLGHHVELPVHRRVQEHLAGGGGPGIAEALFATAIGLIAAIPATIFYNKFTSEVNRQAQRLEGFADEFSAILSRQIDERA